MTTASAQTGYAPINGLAMYYEMHGSGEPLFLLHGGLGSTGMFGEVLTLVAETRQVIAVDLQAHGRTADIERPMRLELLGDDVGALIKHLGFDKVDVMGYSMGGGVALRTAIQHPELVRKLIVISAPFKRDGWYPEMRAGMSQMSAAAVPFMQQTPIYHGYMSVAPKPENFPTLLDKMGEMTSQPYDWSHEIAALKIPVLIAAGDADGFSPLHAAQFFELLGGGKKDGSWDRSGMLNARLAILPNTTHYTIFSSPTLAPIVTSFLDEPMPAST
jgi:pimeloyl-ACP methyl ester carboxylesterase